MRARPSALGIRIWAAAALALTTAWVALLGTLALTLFAAEVAQAAPSVDERTPPPAARAWRATLVRAAHGQWGLDAPVAALAAQVHAESAWRALAVSREGAQGMAQFMPATASWWCATIQAAPADCQPNNPTWALRALVGYDKWLYDRLAAAGGEADRLWATLRAYNGGLGHWQAEAARATSSARADVDAACGKARRAAVHCAENLAYPRRILLELQPRYATWGRFLAVYE